MTGKQILNHQEAAACLGIAKQTLYNWRHDRKGPNYVLLGSKPMYRQEDLDAYIQQHAVILNDYAGKRP